MTKNFSPDAGDSVIDVTPHSEGTERPESKPKAADSGAASAAAATAPSDATPKPDRASAQLLDALVLLARFHGMHLSAAALRDAAGGVDVAFAQEAATIALERKGFTCRWVTDWPDVLEPGLCPLLLIAEDDTTLVVSEIRHGMANVIEPGTQSRSVRQVAELGTLEVKAVLLSTPPPIRSDRADVVAELSGKQWFWGSLWKFRRSFSEVILLTAVVNVLALALTVLSMSVYDRVLPNQAYTTLWALAIGGTIAVVFECFSRIWRANLMDRVGKKLDMVLGALVFRHVMAMRLESQQGRSSGSFAHIIREYESVRDFVTSATLTAIVDMPFMVLFIGVIFYIGDQLAWVPVVAAVLVLTTLGIAQVPLARLLRESLRQTAVRSGLVVEALMSLHSLKSLRAENIISRQHERIAEHSAAISMRTRSISAFVSQFTATIQQLATVAILVWGVYLVGGNKTTAGALMASVMLLSRAMGPLSTVSSLATRFQQTRASLDAINQIMARPLERDPHLSYFHRPQWEGELRADKVSFKYQQDLPTAVESVSVLIKPGEKVAIIGQMGSGKSTLLKVFAGLYQPTSGEVVLDGLDLRHVDVADVRLTLRLLTQDAQLMHGSLLDNLRLASPHASDDMLISAARRTGVEQFAKRHPLGLNLPVGEGGRMLSAGQRQSVALAQVLLSDARILLLDEPTASMDQASEEMIKGAIAQVSQGRTLLLVTHKPALLALVDRIIVIEQGRVLLDGPRDSVLHKLSGGAPVPFPESSANAKKPLKHVPAGDTQDHGVTGVTGVAHA